MRLEPRTRKKMKTFYLKQVMYVKLFIICKILALKFHWVVEVLYKGNRPLFPFILPHPRNNFLS